MKIYTLTLCPAYDIHAYADSFECGRENLITVRSRDAGGKGVNVSRALLSCEAKSNAIIVVGNENSAEFIKQTEGDGITADFIFTDGRIRENITVHTLTGETRISFPAMTADDSILEKINERLDIEKGDIVTLTGRIPDGISMNAIKSFISQLKFWGARVVIDSRSFTLEDIKECAPWLIKPNQEEISAYFKKDIKTLKDAEECALELSLAGIENVLISLGELGALLAVKNRVYSAEPPKIEAVSTIGAGDSMIAGFIAATVSGEGERSSLIRSVAFGSAACLTEGTRPPRTEDVKRIIKSIKSK